MKLKKIRAGLYSMVGLACRIQRRWEKTPCGGELRIEKCGHGDFRWETFCTKCEECDPNGWPTLANAAEEAAEYFQ